MHSAIHFPTNMLALFTIVCIGYVSIATALRCESGSDVQYRSFECLQQEVQQCYKFVCNGTNGQQAFVNRGCLLPMSCSSNMDKCRDINGFGQCYQCDRDDCNVASMSVGSLSAIASGLLLLQLFVRR